MNRKERRSKLDFDLDICGMARCKKSAYLILWVAGDPHGLCDAHWKEYCDESEELACSGRWKNGELNTRVEKALARRRK